MTFRTVKPVRPPTVRVRNSASLRRWNKRTRLLALTAALMLLLFAAGLVWWAFV
jgi:hypothetical protein